MTTYREQLQILEGIRVKEGESRRMPCPFCGGGGTFTISRRQGEVVWNCYRASCAAKGRTGSEMDERTIKQRLENGRERAQSERPLISIPRHLSSPEHHDRAKEYINQNGCGFAYEQRLIEIRYAPAEDRVLFFMNQGEGAVGRGLRRMSPKWRAYGDTTGVLAVGNGPLAVVVEDAASACAVSQLPECTGVALMGTNVSGLQRRQLCAYNGIRVALDRDASRKALKLMGQLEGRIDTRVILLEDDLKYLEPGQIREIVL